jgi:hypothetical protein
MPLSLFGGPHSFSPAPNPTRTIIAQRIMASSSYPIRNIDKLHCSTITYHCALGDPRDGGGNINNKSPCISCAYKIANFDVALDSAFRDIVPNVRPECCPRSSPLTSATAAENNIMIVGYQKGMHVLTVGDGDFSFSIAIAKAVIDKEDASSGMVVATSYENEQTLQNVYPEFTTNLHQLTNFNTNTTRQNIIIGYNVDATNLVTTLPTSINNQCNYYHRIVWNFPCTAILDGQDGQNNEMEHNKELVRKFICNALPFMSDMEGSEIHLLHKTKPPYNQWLLEKVALEGLAVVSNIDVDFVVKDDHNHVVKQPRQRRSRVLEYKGRLVFDKCIYQPYTPRKALDKRSFPCHDACVYIFGWKEDEKKYDKKYNDEHARSSREIVRSTIPKPNNNLTLVKGGECDDLKSFSSQLTMAVTSEVIDRIRSVHIEYATKKKRMTNSTIQGVDDSLTYMTSKRQRRK